MDDGLEDSVGGSVGAGNEKNIMQFLSDAETKQEEGVLARINVPKGRGRGTYEIIGSITNVDLDSGMITIEDAGGEQDVYVEGIVSCEWFY